MSLLGYYSYSVLEMFCLKMVKFFDIRIPKHVAIIMDGNRRYARRGRLQISDGHRKGFDKLLEVMKWCTMLNIEELTVYAFSIENFKRSEEEVTALMQMAQEKIRDMLNDIEEINKRGVRIRVVGRWSLLSDELKSLSSKIMLATRHNTRLQVNLAVAYTGRDEISRVASNVVDGVVEGNLLVTDVNEHLLSQLMDLTVPDLLLRTSGEVRLSDFMLWQVTNTVLYFADVLWPEFSFWDIIAAIMHYHMYAPQKRKTFYKEHYNDIGEFLTKIDNSRWERIEQLALLTP